MKAIIIGGGSIGKRHALNLNNLNIPTRIVDKDEIDNIDNILKEGFDVGLICTPNINHIEHCLKLTEYDLPIFCEKPFYTNTDGIDNLLSIVKEKNLITMVGCNLRFISEIKKINPKSKYINVYFGYDLKKWRPNSNHLKSYSANKNMGGGVLLDVIHELDYLYYKFGKIKNISYIKNKLTNITNDTEDLVTGRIEFENGTLSDFTLNYLSEKYKRYYDILEDGILKRIDLNVDDQMYVDEMEYFINNIKNNTQCMNSFKEAHTLLNHILQ
jgi:predicted dehydrogenase